jgi:hypothetical protein
VLAPNLQLGVSEETTAMIARKDDGGDDDFVLTELFSPKPKEPLDAPWFTERRSMPSSIPPRRSSVPPMGDDEVDAWLR